MRLADDDCIKRRLTGRSEMIQAICHFRVRGVSNDDLPPELAKHFYVDVDLLNELLATLWRDQPAARHATVEPTEPQRHAIPAPPLHRKAA